MSSVSDAEVAATAEAVALKQNNGAPAVDPAASITVKDLTMAFGDFVVMHDLNFTVRRGDVFIIMGASGCGKSTLLRHMIGLLEPAKGEVFYGSESFTNASPQDRERMLRRFGVLYQGGGLWSSMTLAENVALPLAEFTELKPAQMGSTLVFALAFGIGLFFLLPLGLTGLADRYIGSDLLSNVVEGVIRLHHTPAVDGGLVALVALAAAVLNVVAVAPNVPGSIVCS